MGKLEITLKRGGEEFAHDSLVAWEVAAEMLREADAILQDASGVIPSAIREQFQKARNALLDTASITGRVASEGRRIGLETALADARLSGKIAAQRER